MVPICYYYDYKYTLLFCYICPVFPLKMKRFLIIIASVFAIAVSCTEDSVWTDEKAGGKDWGKALDSFYGGFPEITLSVSESEWNRLLEAYDEDNDTQEFIHASVTYKKDDVEESVSDAGLRLKGNTSRRRPEGSDGEKHKSSGAAWHHTHFGVNLRKYSETGDILGNRRFDLKWFKDDPAYVREIYCYDLFRRFGVWTAIRDVYCRLYIKIGKEEPVYYGVYGLQEHISESYLKARKEKFGDAGGNLWKCRYPADLKSAGGIGADDNKTWFTYELKTNIETGFTDASTQLRDFISKLNSLSGEAFYSWIGGVMDIDLFLRTFAVNVAVGMWDDYWNNYNNYYLYFSGDVSSYKLWFIPYDYDNTLGTSQNCGVLDDSGRKDPLKWGHQSAPLTTKILTNPEWKALYISYLKELCTDGSGYFDYASSSGRIRKWQDSIRDYVPNDTGEDTSISDRPASWGNHSEYRILEPGPNNFFTVKAGVINAL